MMVVEKTESNGMMVQVATGSQAAYNLGLPNGYAQDSGGWIDAQWWTSNDLANSNGLQPEQWIINECLNSYDGYEGDDCQAAAREKYYRIVPITTRGECSHGEYINESVNNPKSTKPESKSVSNDNRQVFAVQRQADSGSGWLYVEHFDTLEAANAEMNKLQDGNYRVMTKALVCGNIVI